MKFTSLPPLTVLDIVGADAAKILNNLATAPILALGEGVGHETFITDVRGRTLGHVCVYRLADRLRLIGAAGQGEVIAQHLDRYTIREAASPVDHSETWSGLLVDDDALTSLKPAIDLGLPLAPPLLAWWPCDVAAAGTSASEAVIACQVPWTADSRWLLVGPTAAIEPLRQRLSDGGCVGETAADFARARLANRFPWYGIDLDDRNLPQEVDRDAQAISFTKGCYLGQETVARLDALGQVQKKLVRWRIESSTPVVSGTELTADGKVVGRLTTVVPTVGRAEQVAFGFARRSHFEPGSEAVWTSADQLPIRAVVI